MTQDAADDGLLADGEEPVVVLRRWTGPWPDDDPDANFKADVAAYTLADPLRTIRALAGNLAVPVGAIVRYVLAKWASGGSEAYLELGPSTVQRMASLVQQAEEAGTSQARLAAYDGLRQIVQWLEHGLVDPASTFPGGGAGPSRPRRSCRAAAYGVITDGDRILLCRIAEGWQHAGSWTLPGGGLHHGESPEEAAAREIREETGLPATIGALLGTDSLHLPPDRSLKGDDHHALRLLYLASVPLDRDPRPEQDESTDLAAWIDRGQLDALPVVDLVATALETIGWRSHPATRR